MKMFERLALASSMTLLIWIGGSSTSGDDCPRWNCPCAGQTRLQEMMEKRQNSHQAILQNARQTKDKTRQLLNRIISERFRNNQGHVTSLESCADNRNQRCLGLHLDRNCRLEGFPLTHQIQNIRLDEATLQAFMRDAQQMLSSLAVYVKQARDDETSRVADPVRSLAADIRRIEEDGIYQILCSLQITANDRSIPWDSTVARYLSLHGCRNFSTQAPIDNRNYMVFYTLDRLLNQIGRQVMRKRHSWVEREEEELPMLPLPPFADQETTYDDDDNLSETVNNGDSEN